MMRAEKSNTGNSPRAGITASRVAQRTCHAQRRAAQKESARLAFSCSNPDHGEQATSNALNCSTASPVLALSSLNSQTHRPREQQPAAPEELASTDPLLRRLAVWTVRVKRSNSGVMSEFNHEGHEGSQRRPF